MRKSGPSVMCDSGSSCIANDEDLMTWSVIQRLAVGDKPAHVSRQNPSLLSPYAGFSVRSGR